MKACKAAGVIQKMIISTHQSEHKPKDVGMLRRKSPSREHHLRDPGMESGKKESKRA